MTDPFNFRVAALCCAMVPALALPAEVVPVQGVMSLSSSASVEVANDRLSVSFNTTKEGSDAVTVQAELKQALEAAVAEAKRAERPGGLELHTGNFTLWPRYSNKGQLIVWQGTAELLVEGRDLQAIGQLSGRITTLTVGRVNYGLSRELREKSEGDLAAEAIARFRAKAVDYSRQFGYSNYVIREIRVEAGESGQFRPAPMMQMKAMAAAPAQGDALPVEPGKATVTITVAGTVQMN